MTNAFQSEIANANMIDFNVPAVYVSGLHVSKEFVDGVIAFQKLDQRISALRRQRVKNVFQQLDKLILSGRKEIDGLG